MTYVPLFDKGSRKPRRHAVIGEGNLVLYVLKSHTRNRPVLGEFFGLVDWHKGVVYSSFSELPKSLESNFRRERHYEPRERGDFAGLCLIVNPTFVLGDSHGFENDSIPPILLRSEGGFPKVTLLQEIYYGTAEMVADALRKEWRDMEHHVRWIERLKKPYFGKR